MIRLSRKLARRLRPILWVDGFEGLGKAFDGGREVAILYWGLFIGAAMSLTVATGFNAVWDLSVKIGVRDPDSPPTWLSIGSGFATTLMGAVLTVVLFAIAAAWFARRRHNLEGETDG